MPHLGAPGAWQLLVSSRYGLESLHSHHLDVELLYVQISWWASSFSCGNCSPSSKDIFRYLGPDTSYFRDWKGRGKTYWECDGPELLFFRSEILFYFLLSIFWQPPNGGWDPREEDQARPHSCTSLFGHVKCCLWPTGCLLLLLHCCTGWINISPSIPSHDTAPLKWERVLGVALVNLFSVTASVHQCTLADVWSIGGGGGIPLKEGVFLLTSGPLSFFTCCTSE